LPLKADGASKQKGGEKIERRLVDTPEHDLRSSCRVFEVEGGGARVVGEQIGVARERDDGAQRVLRLLLAHVVLTLVPEPQHRRAMARPFIEHALDVGGQWNMGNEMLGVQGLAFVGRPMAKGIDYAL
jgi:hypothetical protein